MTWLKTIVLFKHHSNYKKVNITFIVLNILFPILAGFIIYFLRPTSSEYIFEHFFGIRLITLNTNIILPNWFYYNLIDGLWAYSLLISIMIVWDDGKLKTEIYILILIVLFSTLLEVLQFFSYIPGTYDNKDILSMILGCLFGYYVFYKKGRIKLL